MITKKVYGGYGAPDRYYLDGVEVSQQKYESATTPKEIGCPMGGQPYVRPILSDAMAVHPDQIESAMEKNYKDGVPTNYMPDGRPIITSHQHQKALAKSYRYFNKDSFV